MIRDFELSLKEQIGNLKLVSRPHIKSQLELEEVSMKNLTSIALLAFFRDVLWRVWLIGSFLALNIFPLTAMLLVDGLLLFTAQGSELIEDLWMGTFIQDTAVPNGIWQMVFATGITGVWGGMLWLTSRFLSDMPVRKRLASFSRIRSDADDALFLRHVGPKVLAIYAIVPLMSIIVIGVWVQIVSYDISYRPDVRLLYLRTQSTAKVLFLVFLTAYLFLYNPSRRWRTALTAFFPPESLSVFGRYWRALSAGTGCLLVFLSFLSIHAKPFLGDLNPKSVHGTQSINFENVSLGVWGSLAFGLLLMLAGRKIIRYWLRPGSGDRPEPMRSHRLLKLLFLQLLATSAFVALLSIDGVGVAQHVGLIPLIMGTGIFWSTLFTLGLIALPGYLGVPSLAGLPVLLFAISSGRNDNHDLRAKALPRTELERRVLDGRSLATCLTRQTMHANADLDNKLLEWLRARIPKGASGTSFEVPIFIVAGSGGGVRAAEFFALTMNRLDERTNGSFGDHVFALSTVSGSSLGAAVWIKARRAFYERLPANHIGKSYKVHTLITQFFARDYTSPIVGALLTKDALQQLLPFLLPGGDRAKIMETAWEQGWSKAVDLEFPDSPPELRQFGELSGLSQAKTLEHSAPPLVVFNSTEVHTGRRFLTATTELPSGFFPDAYLAIDPCSLHGIVDMPLATAAHLSARFTFLSPAATIRGVRDQQADEAYGLDDRPEHTVPWGQIVDGGYFENYGATTARQLAESIVASFARLRGQGLLNESMTLRILGMSVVNDPLDLSNAPLNKIHPAGSGNFSLKMAMDNASFSPQVQQTGAPRFEALWPIANSYDLRELLGLLGVTTPLADLEYGRRLDNEIMAPLTTMLMTRESRGMTAERDFATYLHNLSGPHDDGICGTLIGVRLGSMLRDRNLLRWAATSSSGPATPQFGRGEYAMPNPGLAWTLSFKSKQGIENAVTEDYQSYYREGGIADMERVIAEFEKSSCGARRWH